MANNEKFILELSSNNYDKNPTFQQNFNHYGTWIVDINRDCNGIFTGKIALNLSEFAIWEKMKIRLNFENCSNARYNFSTAARYDQDENVFVFIAACKYDYDHTKFSVEIEIDTTLCSAPIFPKYLNSREHLMEMLESGLLADVIIKTADGNEIKAHNNILSRSEVFYAMLNNHDTKEAEQKVIKILDINDDVLVEMVRYLYCDKVPKIEEIAIDLLVAADKYNIQGLYKKCVLFLWRNVNIENYLQILVTADQLKIKCLKDQAIDYIIQNRKEIFLSEAWQQFKKDNVQLTVEVIEKLSLEFL